MLPGSIPRRFVETPTYSEAPTSDDPVHDEQLSMVEDFSDGSSPVWSMRASSFVGNERAAGSCRLDREVSFRYPQELNGSLGRLAKSRRLSEAICVGHSEVGPKRRSGRLLGSPGAVEASSARRNVGSGLDVPRRFAFDTAA